VTEGRIKAETQGFGLLLALRNDAQGVIEQRPLRRERVDNVRL
jgi:hypothetical protein